MMAGIRSFAVLPCAALLVSAAPGMDPDNPSCPLRFDWGPQAEMTLTPADRDGRRVLLAEGVIDPFLPARLEEALEKDETIEEIWLRSSGGDARAGNEAGRLIRSYPGMLTRIPSGWACFSACNFVFMGGDRRHVDPGGIFMVHMFTHTGARSDIDRSVKEGTDETIELIGEIEQSSALLASEDNDFLIRMGVSRKLLTDIMYRQLATGGEDGAGERYCLSQAEAVEYNVMPVETPAG
ncbi:hypothetical protein [Qipengyuania sp. MTN3-11]|uniref:COG3904 family protein n=1 Tax=Qipengyuania sp. MTN3-11 TaxID=3056557 RepID=UPI0036F395D3